jgi:hypothetical protein
MVDVVRLKPPQQVLGRPLPKGRSGRIRAFQPEEEFPLQTRCRCSGLSYTGQPQVAGSPSPIPTNPAELPLNISGQTGRNRRQYCSPD